MKQSAISLAALLRGNAYPGRCILLGQTPDGRAALAYAIMGRSANSRNRRFDADGDTLRISLRDPSRTGDTALTLYTPLRREGPYIALTNGDHTDTLCAGLARGEGFAAALRDRTFEPDAPHYTPRIAGLMHFKADGFSYALGILARGADGACERRFYDYAPQPGVGHFISTYQGDGDPLPPFAGAPVPVEVGRDLDDFASSFYQALDPDNRVALYVRFFDAAGGDGRVFNR